jgi:hypothetical protein
MTPTQVPDLTNILGIGVLVAAVLFAIWAITFKSKATTTTTTTTVAAPSISRALDDLKYYHADQIIGTTLGTSHALAIGQALAPLAPKPVDVPKV